LYARFDSRMAVFVARLGQVLSWKRRLEDPFLLILLLLSSRPRPLLHLEHQAVPSDFNHHCDLSSLTVLCQCSRQSPSILQIFTELVLYHTRYPTNSYLLDPVLRQHGIILQRRPHNFIQTIPFNTRTSHHESRIHRINRRILD
jgi:hypothetical protein